MTKTRYIFQFYKSPWPCENTGRAPYLRETHPWTNDLGQLSSKIGSYLQENEGQDQVTDNLKTVPWEEYFINIFDI